MGNRRGVLELFHKSQLSKFWKLIVKQNKTKTQTNSLNLNFIILEINKNIGNKCSKCEKKVLLSEYLMNQCSVKQECLFIHIYVTSSSLFPPGIPLYAYQLEYFLHFRDKFKLHYVQCQHSRVLIDKSFYSHFHIYFFFSFNLGHKMLILLAFPFYRCVNWISEEIISCLAFCDF